VNQLYYGDNLDVLRRYISDESVDLVYLDPPFNSNASYNVLFGNQNGFRAAAQIKAFEDTWEWNQAAATTYQETVERGGKVGGCAGGLPHAPGRLQHARLPGHDGPPPRGAAAGPERNGLALPPLRPHGEPLPQDPHEPSEEGSGLLRSGLCTNCLARWGPIPAVDGEYGTEDDDHRNQPTRVPGIAFPWLWRKRRGRGPGGSDVRHVR
jgi:hypothetical protein